MRKQNLALGVFAAFLVISMPAAYAAGSEADESTPGADQAQRQQNDRQQDDRGPPPGPRDGHHGPRLTDAQRTCMDGILGKPGSGERPSHEKMDAAMQTCGVPKPPRGGRPPRREAPPPAEAQE